MLRGKSKKGRFRFKTRDKGGGEESRDGESAATRVDERGETRVEKRGMERGKARFIVEKIKRRRGETTCNNAAGERVETIEDREGGRSRVGKPGRGTVEKSRANEGAVDERERDSAEGPQEREETDLRARRRGIQERRTREVWGLKERVRSKVTPRKVGVGSKVRGEPERWREG